MLIGLHEFTGTGQAQDVIAEYVAREFASAALSAGLTASDVDGAVERLGLQMLNHKCLSPTWNDALGWLSGEDDRKALRALVSKGSVLRVARINGKETIETRHDRVLHSLLAADHASGVLSRSSLAAHGLAWKFRDHPPRSALPYFVGRAANEDLRWPITYMFRGIDDPIAVQHLAEYLADRSRRAEGGFIDHFVKDEWRRLSEDQGRSMSAGSKARLLHLATDPSNDDHLRRQAFKFWEVSVSPDDVAIARAIPHGDLLHDTAVWARARRQDFSVIPELIEKIKTKDPGYWWQAARYIWTDALTALLDESIQKLDKTPEDQNKDIGEWIFPEHVLRLEVSVAQLPASGRPGTRGGGFETGARYARAWAWSLLER